MNVEGMMGLLNEMKQTQPENEYVEKLMDMMRDVEDLERPESDFPWSLFYLNDTVYGLNSKYVQCIESLGVVTSIVDVPAYCPGITHSRGEVIDLLDIRVLFGIGDYMSAKTDQPDARNIIIVTEINGIKRALIVDAIIAVEFIGDFITNTESSKNSRYIRQIAKRKTGETILVITPESFEGL